MKNKGNNGSVRVTYTRTTEDGGLPHLVDKTGILMPNSCWRPSNLEDATCEVRFEGESHSRAVYILSLSL